MLWCATAVACAGLYLRSFAVKPPAAIAKVASITVELNKQSFYVNVAKEGCPGVGVSLLEFIGELGCFDCPADVPHSFNKIDPKPLTLITVGLVDTENPRP